LNNINTNSLNINYNDEISYLYSIIYLIFDRGFNHKNKLIRRVLINFLLNYNFNNNTKILPFQSNFIFNNLIIILNNNLWFKRGEENKKILYKQLNETGNELVYNNVCIG